MARIEAPALPDNSYSPRCVLTAPVADSTEPGSTRTAWGAIARDSLTRHSGEGPYRDGAHAHVRMMLSVSEGSLPKPSSDVAATIVKAVLSRRPKTRYPTGGGARIALFLRRTLSDRGFDTIIQLTTDRARRSMNNVDN